MKTKEMMDILRCDKWMGLGTACKTCKKDKRFCQNLSSNEAQSAIADKLEEQNRKIEKLRLRRMIFKKAGL